MLNYVNRISCADFNEKFQELTQPHYDNRYGSNVANVLIVLSKDWSIREVMMHCSGLLGNLVITEKWRDSTIITSDGRRITCIRYISDDIWFSILGGQYSHIFVATQVSQLSLSRFLSRLRLAPRTLYLIEGVYV